MLNIKNLKVSVENKLILNDLNLKINPGEVHAIMGPNGSGKSTLANVLSGKKGYEIQGEILFDKLSINDIAVEERAQKGIFLAFQYPVEIPGVNTNVFLRTSLNSIRKSKGEKELDTLNFLKLIKEKAKELGITTVGLLGGNGGPALEFCDYSFIAPTKITGRIQELHITAGHIIMELVEDHLIEKGKLKIVK